MNFRYYTIRLLLTTCFLIHILGSSAQGSESLPEPPRQRRPAWWREEGVVMAGSWEALAYRLRGGGPEDYDQKMAAYRREQSEETARRLKELGFNLIMIPLYKGFGLQNEHAAMKDTKRFTAICHKLGLRVGCYTFSGTIGYEAMLAEHPEARDWLIRDQDGKYIYYDVKYYRRWANRSHPGLRAHLREVIRYAAEEAKVDLIHMDNYMVGPGYELYSVEQFREFLKKKYRPEQILRRLGFSVVDYIEPPPLPPTPDRYNADPLYQDWLDYRCEIQADTFRELAEYARSLNPEIIMESNPHGYRGELNFYGIKTGTVDHPRLIQWGGAFWDEGYPSRLENGRLISRFRSHKLGRQFDNMVFQYTPHRVSMAESMANNLQSLGCPAWFSGGQIRPMVPLKPAEALEDSVLNYIRFFRREQRLYRDAEEIADVGVLNTFANTGYGPVVSRQRLAAFEQALYQGKVPFTLVPGRFPGDLSRFSLLVLADLALISDPLLNAIREYVKHGGGLVMTGQATLYDEDHHRRERPGLADLFPESLGEKMLKSPVGKGRAVYIPRVAIPEKFELGMLPENRDELLGAVKWAAGQPLQVRVLAPETVTMSYYRQSQGRKLLHLVNYDDAKPVNNVEVALQMPSGKLPQSVTWLSPDLKSSQTLSTQHKGSELCFTVPRLEVYGVVIIE